MTNQKQSEANQKDDMIAPAQPRRWFALAMWSLVAAGLALAFYRSFVCMWLYHWFPAWGEARLGLYQRLTEGESYYTHGPLVGIVSVALTALLVRHTAIPVKPSRVAGGALLAWSLLVQAGSVFVDVQFVQGFAFVGVVAGLVLLVWGKAALVRLWFPIALLTFMMPMPPIVIEAFNFRLKMLAAEWGVGLANAFGILCEQNGSKIFLGSGQELTVGNACSGLRTLIALIGFGALYAYVCRLSGWWRVWLFAMSIPVAVVSNCIRILVLIIVGKAWGTAFATGWFHDSSGIVVLVCALLLMFGLEKAVFAGYRLAGKALPVRPLFAGVRRGPEHAHQGSALVASAGGFQGIFAAGLVLATAVSVQGMGNLGGRTQTAKARAAVPLVLTVGGVQYRGTDFPLGATTLRILQTDDCVSRRYEAAGKEPCFLLITYSEGNRRGSHTPEVCLTGEGRVVLSRRDLAIEGVDGHDRLPCRELVIESADGLDCYLYSFKYSSEYTSSWYVQQVGILWRSLLGQKPGGALIQVSVRPAGRDVDAARRQLSDVMKTIIPLCDSGLR